MLKIETYAPNLEKLLGAFDYFYDQEVTDVTSPEDDYLLFLLKCGALIQEGNHYSCGPEWRFMTLSGNERLSGLREFLSNQEEVKGLLRIIGDGGVVLDDILDQSGLPKTAGMTLLPWMESLGMIRLQDGAYYPDLSLDISPEENTHEARPVYNAEIEIKEDKYSVFEYIRKINRGLVVLNPDFQRNLVWKPLQKSKFIESILMNLPIPPIYLKKDSDGKYIVVDGLQRTTTLLGFLNNDFALDGLESMEQLNGCRFQDLDKVQDGLAARLEDRQLNFYIMLPSVPMRVVYDVFNRINTGGTQLTRQEIRNCVFPGPSTKFLKEIAESEVFATSVDYGIRPQRMKDREAILRCVAYVIIPDYKTKYSGSLDEFLEQAMRALNKMSLLEINALKESTADCFSLTHEIFGRSNFRIPTDYTRGRINMAVMETVFNCFYGVKDISRDLFPQLQRAMDTLLNNEDYINAVVASTGSSKQVFTRFEIAHSVFDKILNK